MSQYAYLNFDLHLAPEGEGYRARVLGSPAGNADASIASAAFAGISTTQTVDATARFARPTVDAPSPNSTREQGRRLFEALFPPPIQLAWEKSLARASEQSAGLRLRLRLTEVPELTALPWETLYDPARDRFLALSTDTPLVRYMEIAEGEAALAVEPPLSLLALISNPVDVRALDVEGEWAQLEAALTDLGHVRVARVADATLPHFQETLQRTRVHLFHYIGHGAWDEDAKMGVLLLEDERGHARAVPSDALAVLLAGSRAPRLVVLNACEGARGDTARVFSGVAQHLVRQGIPAVIAMQAPISDRSAVTFARAFYSALAAGYPVDAALAEARKAIYLAGSNEWALPVLFMRAPDGRLFDLSGDNALAPPTAAYVPLDDSSATSPGSAAAPPTAPGDAFAYDAYLSYVDQEPDTSYVWDTLLPRLEEAGLRVAISGDAARPGVAVIEAMEEGVTAARRTIVVLSDAYLADHAARLENVMAQTLGMEEEQSRVIPVTFTDFDRSRLPLRLRMLTPVNLSHPRRAARELERLVMALSSPLASE